MNHFTLVLQSYARSLVLNNVVMHAGSVVSLASACPRFTILSRLELTDSASSRHVCCIPESKVEVASFLVCSTWDGVILGQHCEHQPHCYAPSFDRSQALQQILCPSQSSSIATRVPCRGNRRLDRYCNYANSYIYSSVTCTACTLLGGYVVRCSTVCDS